MMTTPQTTPAIFRFEDRDVRIIDQEGNAWFVLKDVLSAMGSSTRPSIAKTSIDQGLGDGVYDEYPITDSLGRQQTTTIVSEAAVTFLVSRSNTENGRKLNRWIHGEVLPQIRKTGGYQLPNFNNPVEAARAWADAKEAEQQALAQLESAKPAVAFVEKYVTTTGNKGFRAVAKLLGVKERVFRYFLIREKIQYKLGGEWLPYAQHINLNRFVVKTGATENYTYNQALFTPKGVEWIADKWNRCKHRYGY